MSSNENREEFLKKLALFPIFKGTQGYQLEQVVKSSWLIKYKAGDVIFEPNDYSNAFYLILSGVVRLQIHAHKALELGPGRYFGEYSLIEKRQHNTHAQAIADTELLIIPSDIFNNLLQQSLPFSNNLLKTLVKRLKSKERLEYALIEKNNKINQQNQKILEQNESIRESIEYAGIIQRNLLPSEKLLKLKFESCFLIFQPYQKVSGDFYWFAQRYNEYCLAIADCTGHGVPAGLISILGITYLNEIVNSMQDPNPGKILSTLNKKIKQAFSSSDERFQGHHSMDIALICINFETLTLRYAGANLPAFIARDKKIMELPPVKNSLGSVFSNTEFITETIKLLPNDRIYLFTDGIIDQLGGDELLRFGYARFKNMLESICFENIYKQKRLILSTYFDWKGSNPQLDDVTVFGLEV